MQMAIWYVFAIQPRVLHAYGVTPRHPLNVLADDILVSKQVAIAVGSQNGAPRNQVIAGLHPDTGVAGLALSPGRTDKSAVFVNMSGAALAKSPASQELESKMDNTANNTATAPNALAAATAPTGAQQSQAATDQPSHDPHVPTSSRAGMATIPFRDENISPPRQGTSETRFEQQAETHAGGQLAHATPEVKVDGQGEKSSVMEPATVGQAPKEHPVPEPETAQPGIVEQAQTLAASAIQQTTALPQTIISAIGLGGSKPEPPSDPAPKEDPAVDQVANPLIEDFLRSKTMSTAQPVEGK